jgi:integrase
MNTLINITSKQLKQIEEKNSHVEIYTRIALYTGLRYSSIAEVTYDDVIREGNNYFLIIKKMKRQKDVQKVRISKDIFIRIQNHRKQSKYNNYVIEGQYSNKALSIQYINKILNFVLGCSSHKLRHTAALVNKLNGTEIDLISNFLFHKNIATSMIYTAMAHTMIRLYGRQHIKDYLSNMKKYVCILND